MIDKFDYKEPCCAFDREFYKDKQTVTPKEKINVSEMINQVDRLYSRNRKEDAVRVLNEYAHTARENFDYEGELSAINELIGSYRMSKDVENGKKCIERCFELLKLTGIGGSISAGTILINAATALSSFGEYETALNCYKDAARCYSNHLPTDDERMASLYNNMASAYEGINDVKTASDHYKRAINILQSHFERKENILDCAVSYTNLALLYAREYPEEGLMDEYANKAIELFEREDVKKDFYFAHTAEKCVEAFEMLGYFLVAENLKELAESIYSKGGK